MQRYIDPRNISKLKPEKLIPNKDLAHIENIVYLPGVQSISAGKIRWTIHLLKDYENLLFQAKYQLGKYLATLEAVKFSESKEAIEKVVGVLYHKQMSLLISGLRDCMRKDEKRKRKIPKIEKPEQRY